MGAAEATRRRRRALLVACDDYADPNLSALRAPVSDVRAFRTVLGDPQIGRFATEELINGDTSEVKQRIEGFFRDAGLDDLLLLYITGHGVLRRDRFYFATRTTRLEYLLATAVEDSFVSDVINHCRARTVVLILDCCHSGAYRRGLGPKSDQTVSMEHRFEGDGRVTMTASTALEYAFEGLDEDTHVRELEPRAPGSLFTGCIVDALRSGEADVDEDGEVSIEELYRYVYRRLRDRQTPTLTGDRSGEIYIARSRRQASLPADVRDAIKSQLAPVRKGAVESLAGLLESPRGPVAEAARAALRELTRDDSQSVAKAAEAALAPPSALPPPPPPPPPWWSRVRLHHLPRRWAVAAVAGLVVVAAAAIWALTRGPDSGGAPFEFTGDGRQSLVMSTLGGDVGGAGFVLVYRDLERNGEPIDETYAGVKGESGGDDDFGSALASGDFDDDGHADLAIGVRGRNLVTLLYGTESGPSNERTQQLGAPTAPGGGEVTSYGGSLAAADFNDDDHTDLAIGAPGAGTTSAGAVRIVFGGKGGLSRSRGRWLRAPEANLAKFGNRLAAGDVDGDGDVDLLEGSQDRTNAAVAGHGSFCPGATKGPRRCHAFGSGGTSSLAIADVDGRGPSDVVQGDSTDPPPASAGAGEVRIWLGREDGPSREPIVFDQGDLGLGQIGEAGDAFGAIVDAADLDGDDMADIVVAAPGKENALGRVFIVRGADTGYAREGNVAISPRSVGLDYAQADSQFGAALSILRLTDPDRFDLAVAMGGEADRAASGDGSLGRAATVIPDIGSMLDGQRPAARQLPGLDEIQAGGEGRIRFARPPKH